jgi:hypothetical protein
MKKIHHLLLSLTLLFSLFTLHLQGQKPCNNYACVIEKVERLMKQSQKDYKAILDNLDSAEGYPDSKAEQIRGLRRQAFILIEKEKDEAKKAKEDAEIQKKEAERQTLIAKLEKLKSDSLIKVTEGQKKSANMLREQAEHNATNFKNELMKTDSLLREVKYQKQISDSLLIVAKNQTQKVKSSLERTNFYDGKIGLVYNSKEKKFGYIDANLNSVIDFKYDEATPFSYPGFARVKYKKTLYLIDTLGIERKLDTAANKLNSRTIALDITGKALSYRLFNYSQLQILLMGSTGYKFATAFKQKELVDLKNLVYLDLSNNGIQSIPDYIFAKISHLSKLKHLDLRQNNIPLQEKSRLNQLLPNCKILF